MELYNNHTFTIKHHDVPGLTNNWTKGFYYVIYDKLSNCIEGIDYFESEQKARFAAIGHISLLELKENNK